MEYLIFDENKGQKNLMNFQNIRSIWLRLPAHLYPTVVPTAGGYICSEPLCLWWDSNPRYTA